MTDRTRLPTRERVFIRSLQYHGFRLTRKRSNLKYAYGYVIPATQREDSSGIDLWVKMPKTYVLMPVQVTQRGVKIHIALQRATEISIKEIRRKSKERLESKKRRCNEQGILFVLVVDYLGEETNQRIARKDVGALRRAIR